MLRQLFFAVLVLGVVESQGTEPECKFGGVTIYVNESGVITTPGYHDGKYPPQKDCLWNFTGPKNKYIQLRFTDFEFEVSQQCTEDHVQVEWKAMDYESYRYCGTSAPMDITVKSSQELVVFFNSNKEKEFRGFRLEYSLLDKYSPCPPKNLRCRNGKCVLRSKMCDGVDDCTDGTDEEKCGYKVEKPSSCGKTPYPPEKGNDRIVGGRPAMPYSWPWQVSLQRTDVFPSGHFCGASLINNLWIVTAAHCLLNRDISEIRVKLGIYEQYTETEGVITRYIDEAVIFRGFEDQSLKNDIALLKLSAPVQYSDRIQPVCIPNLNEKLAEGNMVHSTGWGERQGFNSQEEGRSSVLKQTMLPVTNWFACEEAHHEIRQLHDGMFCAGYTAGGHATCHADSGGPLVAEKEDIWTLRGLVSWGPYKCALPFMPSVFTQVSKYVEFINNVYKA